MSTVHDFAKEISEILPGDPVVGFQVVEEDVHADHQVARVEGVRFIPALKKESKHSIPDK